jgi:hypothetical protein
MKKIVTIALSLAILGILAYPDASARRSRNSEGMLLHSTYVYSQPDAYDRNKIRVNRGEAIKILDEKENKDTGSWCQVELSDEETRGWVRTKYIHRGPKRPITLTHQAGLYQRPDEQSRKVKTLQRGATMYILKEKGDWMKVSVTFDLIGWVKTDKYVAGIKKRDD